MRELTIGSLFDGSGGFPLAAALEGIRPVWASEVEPYPIAVTRSRFPHMKHYGDVSQLNGAMLEPVDIITFGSPCQDLSVAGKRAGLKHEDKGDKETTRSGLFLEAIRIIREMREATHGVYPAYAIWENVTGAFSSSKGEDFRTVLNEFVNVVEPGAEVPPPPQGRWPYADVLLGDGWSVAYRTFDAQYWGVPQRRRRIYLVADFRGESAGKILFKRKGLRGYPSPSREARERTAADTQNGIGATDTESVELYEPRSMKEENWTQQAVKGALRAEASKSAHVLIDSIGTADKSAAFKITNSATARTIGYEEEKSPTLSAENGGWPLNFSGGVCLPKDVIPINTMVATRGGADDGRTTFGVGEPGEPQFTLQAAHSHAVAYGIDRAAFNQGKNAQYKPQFDKELSAALIARGPNAVCCWDGDQTADSNCVSEEKMEQRYIVRHLTPLECCRLQGFPDGWGETDAKEDFTDEEFAFWLDVRNTHGQINGKAIRHYTKAQMLTWYNKLHTDSAEYKMWGNGIALPCATYVMQGIVEAVKEDEENV